MNQFFRSHSAGSGIACLSRFDHGERAWNATAKIRSRKAAGAANFSGSNLLGYLEHNSQRGSLSGETNLLAGPWTQVRDAKPSTETGIWGSVSRARDDASRQVKTSASRTPFSVYGVIEARRCLATKVTGQNRGTLQFGSGNRSKLRVAVSDYDMEAPMGDTKRNRLRLCRIVENLNAAGPTLPCRRHTGPIQITQNQAGCVSNGKERCERDGLSVRGIAASRTKLPFAGVVEENVTPEPSTLAKTGYERTEEYHRVTQPILFP